MMNEAFLFFAWKFRLFSNFPLHTISGETIEIVKPGELNTDAGPDFFNARVKIGDTLWAGNIEMHLKASDWLKHGHQKNNAYHNIILHVVYEADITIPDMNFSVFELRNFLDKGLWDKYRKMHDNESWIPCAAHLGDVDPITLFSAIDRMLLEKLEIKTAAWKARLQMQTGNWEELLYQQLASNFGFKINSTPFQLLAQDLPYHLLMRYRENTFAIEALVFGQSGLLQLAKEKDAYTDALLKEYKHLARKHHLKPIDAHLWKFLRMRPMNFPSIRLAQFADLIVQSNHLFSRMLHCNTLLEFENLFDLHVSDYWNAHFVLGKQSKTIIKKMGINSIHNILINSILPFVFFYGKQKNEEQYCHLALDILKEMPAEKNQVINKWVQAGVKPENAHDSQGLLFLKENFCFQKKCLSCGIGKNILRN